MNNTERPSFTNEISEEQERLISTFEDYKCPECGKDPGRLNDPLYKNFCDEDCFKKYEETDPNLVNFKKAEGEFNYRYSLSQDAQKLGMDITEYRKLRESNLSYTDIAKMKGKE